MVKAGNVLFAGGTPDIVPKDDPWAAIEGRAGGCLHAISASDGAIHAEYELHSAPILDGIAAGDGKLFVTHQDGTLTCFDSQ